MLKNVVDKEKKANANNLKIISHATDEQTARDCLDEVGFIREAKCLGCMNRWSDNWDWISLIFKFSQATQEVIYNQCYREPEQQFPLLESWPHRTIPSNVIGLLKALTEATWELTKKGTMLVWDWGRALQNCTLCTVVG